MGGGWRTVTSPELSYLAALNNYHLPSPGGPGPPAAGSAARKAGGWSPEAGEPPAQLGRFTGKPCQRSNSDVSERSWNVDCTSAWRQRVGPGAPMPHPPGGGGVFLSLSLGTDLVQEEPAPSSSLAIGAAELPSWPPAPSLQLWPPPPTRPHATHHSTPAPQARPRERQETAICPPWGKGPGVGGRMSGAAALGSGAQTGPPATPEGPRSPLCLQGQCRWPRPHSLIPAANVHRVPSGCRAWWGQGRGRQNARAPERSMSCCPGTGDFALQKGLRRCESVRDREMGR